MVVDMDRITEASVRNSTRRSRIERVRQRVRMGTMAGGAGDIANTMLRLGALDRLLSHDQSASVVRFYPFEASNYRMLGLAASAMARALVPAVDAFGVGWGGSGWIGAVQPSP